MTLPCWCSWSLGLTSDRLRPTTSRLSVGSYLTQATKCTLTSEKDKHHFPHDGLALDIIKIIFDNAAFLFNSWKREPGQSAAAEHCSHSHERSWIISELKVYLFFHFKWILEWKTLNCNRNRSLFFLFFFLYFYTSKTRTRDPMYHANGLPRHVLFLYYFHLQMTRVFSTLLNKRFSNHGLKHIFCHGLDLLETFLLKAKRKLKDVQGETLYDSSNPLEMQ